MQHTLIIISLILITVGGFMIHPGLGFICVGGCLLFSILFEPEN
jgi:tetrahydromethanopterin S-methyltransferase subunit D